MIVDRLDGFDIVEFVTVEVNIDNVTKLLLGGACRYYRLWHHRLDSRPEIQIESYASRDAPVESKTIDISKCKRPGAKDIDQIGIIGQSFGKPNDDFALGVTQSDVGRGDKLVVTTGENQRGVGGRVATDTGQAIAADESRDDQFLSFSRRIDCVDHLADSCLGARVAVEFNTNGAAAYDYIRRGRGVKTS